MKRKRRQLTFDRHGWVKHLIDYYIKKKIFRGTQKVFGKRGEPEGGMTKKTD